jgi:hypothetical protein
LSEPVWADIRSIREELSSNPVNSAAAGQLTEALNQVLMRLHGGRSWGELRGKERAQRQRALALVLTVSAALFLLSVAAASFAWYADSQREIAVARQLALASRPTPEGLPPAIESLRIRHSQEAVDKLFGALEVVPRLKRKIPVKAPFWPPVYSDDSHYLGIVGDDRIACDASFPLKRPTPWLLVTINSGLQWEGMTEPSSPRSIAARSCGVRLTAGVK